jgi:apolipoprotein N-acyltransferase
MTRSNASRRVFSSVPGALLAVAALLAGAGLGTAFGMGLILEYPTLAFVVPLATLLALLCLEPFARLGPWTGVGFYAAFAGTVLDGFIGQSASATALRIVVFAAVAVGYGPVFVGLRILDRRSPLGLAWRVARVIAVLVVAELVFSSWALLGSYAVPLHIGYALSSQHASPIWVGMPSVAASALVWVAAGVVIVAWRERRGWWLIALVPLAGNDARIVPRTIAPLPEASLEVTVVQPRFDNGPFLGGATRENIAAKTREVLALADGHGDRAGRLVVLPESALPGMVHHGVARAEVPLPNGGALVFGAIRQARLEHENAVFVAEHGALRAVYAKRDLVPLEESAWLRAGSASNAVNIGDRVWSVLVCKELYNAAMLEEARGADRTGVLVLSNIEDRRALALQRVAARWTALSLGRPVIVASNFGASGVIDPARGFEWFDSSFQRGAFTVRVGLPLVGSRTSSRGVAGSR